MALTQLKLAASPVAGGRAFGGVGPYEELRGTASFALDPRQPLNQVITDLDLAPQGADGRVHFSADVALLRPVDSARGNRRLLFDIPNRGRPIIFRQMDTAFLPLGQTGEIDPGDGWLLGQGYTIAWCGWQHDVPRKRQLLGLTAPHAMAGGKPLTGKVLSTLQTNAPTESFSLTDRTGNMEHEGYPALDVGDPAATLTERDYPFGPARRIPRDRWRFGRERDGVIVPDPNRIHYADGFQAGKLYEAVYTAVGAPLTGLGLAATRDLASFLRFASAGAGNPCAGAVDRTLAFGASQSGRFLRHLLYLGLCEDEQERLAFDALLVHIAGARRTEANWRFGQPSYVGPYTTSSLFPFTDNLQTEPGTGRVDGLQRRAQERGKAPKVMYTNTSVEYWTGQAALIHTALDGKSDAAVPDNVRIYHFSGTQHGTLPLPLSDRNQFGERAGYLLNSIDYRPLLRAALLNLDAWITGGEVPPPSRYPRLREGTLVERDAVRKRFAGFPGPGIPEHLPPVARLDFGPEASRSQATQLPPVVREPYPALVPGVDADGNELGGLRHPDIAVPVATYTGWNPRHPSIGGQDQPLFLVGATILFPRAPEPQRTAEPRASASGPRPSLQERYPSRQAFLELVRQAALALVDQRLLLAQDVERIVAYSARRYDELAAAPTAARR